MLLLLIIIGIILFILWTMLRCASIYDEIEENYKKNNSENNINLQVTKK